MDLRRLFVPIFAALCSVLDVVAERGLCVWPPVAALLAPGDAGWLGGWLAGWMAGWMAGWLRMDELQSPNGTMPAP